ASLISAVRCFDGAIQSRVRALQAAAGTLNPGRAFRRRGPIGRGTPNDPSFGRTSHGSAFTSQGLEQSCQRTCAAKSPVPGRRGNRSFGERLSRALEGAKPARRGCISSPLFSLDTAPAPW